MITFLMKLAHLLSFSTAWGATFWFTFFGGLISLLNLPRHLNGNLESKMFPVYFRLIGICCSISLASFSYLNPWKSMDISQKYQFGLLFSALTFNLANLFGFGPITIKVMKERHVVERMVGIGTEIGWHKNVEIAKTNRRLRDMNHKFDNIHRLAALTYIFTISTLALHLSYLAFKLDL